MTRRDFDSLFTPDRPIHFNFHGYATEIKGLLFGRPHLDRVTIECYREEGSTTTPFDIMLRNNISRYHVMEAAIRDGAKHNPRVALDITSLLAETRHQISKAREYIMATGKGESTQSRRI
jgi:xylulose-5-phosphate/fructose-6-phosphate phosphoketolase